MLIFFWWKWNGYCLLPLSQGKSCEEEERRGRSFFELTEVSSVTISVGVAQLIAEDTLETFVAEARQALSDAREGGGNRVFKADRLS